jgi:hypothetical protein
MTAAPGAEAAQTTVGNPSLQTPQDEWMQLDISQDDIDHLVRIVSVYRDQWCTDRLVRQRIWIKNVLFYRGIQVLDWYQDMNGGSGGWVDTLAWYQGSNKTKDGESTELEKYIHPITLMLGQTFIGVLGRDIPTTVVKPEDARIPADMTTATAAQQALKIIGRANRERQMTRNELELLYLYGTYFKYTRGVLDGMYGYNTELDIQEIDIERPDVMRCMQCGQDTAVGDLQPVGQGSNPECPNCGAAMGPESYFPGGPAKKQLGMVGVRKVPRAMVRQTVHGPLEIDADPQAKDLSGTPILAFDQEIDVGEARTMFPKAWEDIHEGEPASTTAMADYDRLRRNEIYAMGTAYTTDTNQQRPTWSQVWVQPVAYSRDGDYEFMQRMQAAAPEGLKLTMIGSKVVGVKKAVLTKEWSCCRLHENFGLYSPSVAEFVVSFNERFNAAMQAYDDYMMRAPFGLNLINGSKIDIDKWKGNTLAPTSVTPVWLNPAANESLGNVFAHFDIPVNPGLALYPQMLWMFAQVLNGLPAQLAGSGTSDDVDTFGGQKLQMAGANAGITPYWESLKQEHAEAAQNAVECLRELLRTGAAQEIWDVIEDRGARFRNTDSIDFSKLRGNVRCFTDEDQDLPQSPEQIRENLMTVFDALQAQNPAAERLFDVPANQEKIGSVLFPNLVGPITAQRAKTLSDLGVLAQPGAAAEPVQNPDGSIGSKLPVEPSVIEDMEIAIATISEYMIENADIRIKNPVGWSLMEQYFGACQDMQAQQQVRTAKLQVQVQAAAAPPSSNQPSVDPDTVAAVRELQGMATQMVERLGALSMLDPSVTKGTAAAQVSAASNIVKTAINAGKELRLAEEKGG